MDGGAEDPGSQESRELGLLELVLVTSAENKVDEVREERWPGVRLRWHPAYVISLTPWPRFNRSR